MAVHTCHEVPKCGRHKFSEEFFFCFKMFVPLFCLLLFFSLKNRQLFLSHIRQAWELEHWRKNLFEMLTCNDIYLLTPASSASQAEHMFGFTVFWNIWRRLLICLFNMWFPQESKARWKQSLPMLKAFNSLLKTCVTFIRMHQTSRVSLLVLHPDKAGISDWGVASWPSFDCSPKVKGRKLFKWSEKSTVVTELYSVFYWPFWASSSSVKRYMLHFIMLMRHERHT